MAGPTGRARTFSTTAIGLRTPGSFWCSRAPGPPEAGTTQRCWSAKPDPIPTAAASCAGSRGAGGTLYPGVGFACSDGMGTIAARICSRDSRTVLGLCSRRKNLVVA